MQQPKQLLSQFQNQIEEELEQLLRGQLMDPMDVFKNGDKDQIKYYMDVRRDIENPDKIKLGLIDEKDTLNDSSEFEVQPRTNYMINNNQNQESDDYDDDDDENKLEETTTKDDNQFNEEIKKELIIKQDGTKIYKITYDNGDIYEGSHPSILIFIVVLGEIENNMKDGSGIYYYANGEKYDGLFQEDFLHGYGVYYFLGGHIYEGDWYKGEKQGIGILQLASGDQYQGEFYKDLFDGKGNYLFKNGDKFEGEWKKGKKNGYGKFYGKDGRRIFGEWIDDEMQHF